MPPTLALSLHAAVEARHRRSVVWSRMPAGGPVAARQAALPAVGALGISITPLSNGFRVCVIARIFIIVDGGFRV